MSGPSGPFKPARDLDHPPQGNADYGAGVDDDTHADFGAAATASAQRATSGDDRQPDSYAPGGYSYPTPTETSRLGF
jgi:hypothetical protein